MSKLGTGRVWTKKEDHHLIKRWHAGDTQDQIGRALGVTKNSIAGRVIRLRSLGADIPRRAGGDPALKQRKRQKKKADTHNAKLNPRVKKELQRRQDKIDANRRSAHTAKPFKPLKGERPEPYLGKKPSDHNYAAPGANSSKHLKSSAPKIDAIPEIEGTTCTTKFLDLKRGQCRYVHGFGEGKLFCDGVAKPGSSMCELHHALCYRQSPRQFDRAAARVAR